MGNEHGEGGGEERERKARNSLPKFINLKIV